MQKTKQNQLLVMGWLGIISILFLFPKALFAAENSNRVNIFSTEPIEKIRSFQPFNSSANGSMAVGCDLNSDSIDEIVVAAGSEQVPLIRTLDINGNDRFTKGWLAYDKLFRGGVNVACQDLNNDGFAEIITVPKSRAPAHVRIFDRFGHPILTSGFFAFPADIRNGANLAVGDIDGGGVPEIIVSLAYGSEPKVKVFNTLGQVLPYDIFPFHSDFKGGVSLATANLDHDSTDELIVGVQSEDVAWIKVLKIGTTGIQTLSMFQAFSSDFKGGVNVAGGDINNDGRDEILAAANFGGGPQVRAFSVNGESLDANFFAYDQSFRNGVNISASDINNDGTDEVITSPGNKRITGRIDYPRYIEVDISNQTLKYFDHGVLIGQFSVSTGKVTMPTPLGEFKIMNKAVEAYSKKYGLYMPYWMQITSEGHGFHGLPFWKLKGGGVIYEGENHIGVRVSHGCVRMLVPEAAKLWNWATVGTPVIIHS
jgi:lipoprotein-anchoring transpeptidase ErfK/SrfK